MVPVGGSESAPASVTILGSGFTGRPRSRSAVCRATSFTVDSHNEITATPPPFSGGPVRTAARTGVYRGENASNDICQVQVRVANADGTARPGTSSRPPEGAVTSTTSACWSPRRLRLRDTAGADRVRLRAAPRSPRSRLGGPGQLASEEGSTVITVQGAGFDPLTIDWADFGDPACGSSMDTDFVFMTGTEMQIVAPGETRPAIRSQLRSASRRWPASPMLFRSRTPRQRAHSWSARDAQRACVTAPCAL